MNIFDQNKINPGTNLPINNNAANTQPVSEKEPATYEQMVGGYVKVASGNYFDGSLLNNSDSELIGSHLEQFLHSDSLRLEIQIERASKDLEATQKQLQALNLLPNSEVKTNQQRVLLAKRQNIVENLNYYKEEYRNLGPLHKGALWLKDKLKSTNNIADGIKKAIYGKEAQFLSDIKTAKTSIELLSNQLETLNTIPGKEETNLNMIDILRQYDKIGSEIEQKKQDYYTRTAPKFLDAAKEKFQKLYYGYAIPKESYEIPEENEFLKHLKNLNKQK